MLGKRVILNNGKNLGMSELLTDDALSEVPGEGNG